MSADRHRILEQRQNAVDELLQPLFNQPVAPVVDDGHEHGRWYSLPELVGDPVNENGSVETQLPMTIGEQLRGGWTF